MRKTFKWLRSTGMLRTYRPRICLLMVLTVLQSVLQVTFAFVTRSVVDAALTRSAYFLHWGCTLVGVLLLLVGVHSLYAWLTGSTLDKSVARFRLRLLEAAANSEGERLHAYHSGALLNRGMEDVIVICDGVINTLPYMIGQITRLAGALAAVVVLYPALTPVLLVAGALLAMLSAGIRPRLKKHHARVRNAEERVFTALQEDLQQLELIRGLEVQTQVLRRFESKQRLSLKAKKRRRYWSVSVNSAVTLASQLATGILLLWGASRVAGGEMSYGVLTAILQLVSLFRNPVLGLSGLWTKLAGVEVAGERLQALLVLPEERAKPVPVEDIQAVVFEDVTFCYPDDEMPVLSHFSAAFPLEQWACLTGISGKGKTTLFKLILGLYTPQEGRVYLRTQKGDVACGKQTRQLFAYVPQDYALFSGTILENLLLVAPDADETQRRQALTVAQAGFVWDLPQGEHTLLRENNGGLSMGQMQRLAIARAVLSEHPILLLDECTSALDAQTELQVLTGLADLGRQAILVTHRPDALRDLERISFVNMDE